MAEIMSGPIGTMRFPHADLPILSAEVFDDGAAYGSASHSTKHKTQHSTSASYSTDDVPRKRTRTQAADAAEPEEEKKRARGRPRLDTKDETAADRRRTQIRLAQRAYRNRKENAIQTLEKRVQELKDTNEEMSNAFLRLHDFAMSTGLLDKTPELGRQLRETTEKFLSLAREASDDDAEDGEPRSTAASNRADSQRARSDSPQHNGNHTITAARTPRPADTLVERPKHLWAGLMMTTGHASPPSTTTIDFPISTATDFTISSSAADFSVHPPTTSSFPYEVVTQPTLDNATFGFPGSFDFFSSTSTTTITGPSTTTPTAALSPPSPFAPLPSPHSYAAIEATFGRRLQRYTLERALVLMSMPNPPQAIVTRVFGFCLLLESPQTIKRRLLRLLGHDGQHSLFNWQFPFYHLGGAGTHLDAGAMAAQRVGNQGMVDVLKPGATAGFATGPFSPEVNAVRDGKLDRDMRMALPGWAGEYFDCDETEMYLCERGVVIPPGADIVAVEVDPAQFGRAEDAAGGEWSWRRGGSPAHSVGSSESESVTGASSVVVGGGLSPPPVSRAGSAGAAGSPPAAAAAWPNMVDPALAEAFAQAAAGPFMAEPAAAGAFGATSSGDGSEMMAFAGLMPDGAGGAGFGLAAATRSPSRRRLVLDVQLFVEELTRRGVCLGRTPGFKEEDIHVSFWAAVQAA